jgi:putative ABC transport system permease protein
MFRYLPLIVKNGLRNKRRSLLTIASVAISLCLLGLLGAIYHAFYFSVATPEQALRLVTRNKISLATVMPLSYQQKIQSIPGVREVMVQQWFGGVYKEPKNLFARFAVEPERFFSMYSEFKVPEDQQKAFIQERSACVIGRALADRFGFKLGDRITLVGDIFPVNPELTVRAIYDSDQNNEALFFNIHYLYDGLPVARRDFAGTYYILVDKPESVSPVSQQIDEMFRNSTIQTRTETEQAFQLGFLSFLGSVKVFLMSICAAVTFTILLVSANTMAMSVRERIREVGILKTLGFNNSAILGMILGEAAFLSLVGGIIGCLLANVLTFGVRKSPIIFTQLKTLTLVPSVAAIILVVGIFIGVLSSLIPAWNASRTNILDSLRYSG